MHVFVGRGIRHIVAPVRPCGDVVRAGQLLIVNIELEKLRELQYDAGLHEEARQTIKRIISLNPPNGAHYQQMLRELGG